MLYDSNKSHTKYSSKLRPKCLKTGFSRSDYSITLTFTSCEEFLFLKPNKMQSFPFCLPELSSKPGNITFQSCIYGISWNVMLHVSNNVRASCN